MAASVRWRVTGLEIFSISFSITKAYSLSGGFPTATATGTDLEGIARAAGIPKVATVRDLESFKAAVIGAGHANELTTTIAKVEATGPAGYVTGLALLENRFQFSRHIQSLKQR